VTVSLSCSECGYEEESGVIEMQEECPRCHDGKLTPDKPENSNGEDI
jgi:predicted Zn-ribbon and HTH transcriptional regulator